MRDLFVALPLIGCLLIGGQAHAQLENLLGQDTTMKFDESEPVLYYADDQNYDAELQVLILRGNVEFLYQGEVLEADYVTYSQESDLVTASGNVRLRRKRGDVVYGKYLELTGNMKEGFIRQARALMTDNARVAAAEGRKTENTYEFDKAVYTPCQLCGEGDTPTWQLDASRIVRDEEAKRYYFTDATMKFLGVPVAYFPLLYHPTERQSGLLAPLIGKGDKKQGWFYAQPVYIVTGRNSDLTLTPVVFTREHPLGIARYRHAFSFGRFQIEGSFIEPRYTNFTERKDGVRVRRSVPHHRGHVLAQGSFSITENIRFRGKGGWVSDDTYFKKYPFFGNETNNSLDSKAILEGFWDQDYAAVKVYHFQSLNSNVEQDRVAHALPYIEYHALSGRDSIGGRLYFDSNFLSLVRANGRTVERGTGVIGWQLPMTLPTGQVLSVFAEGNGHLYHVDHAPNPVITQSGSNGTHYRLFPKAGTQVSWPFVTTFFNNATVLEPIGQVIVSSKGLNPKDIPNEDSVGFEFSDSNLFFKDRIPGEDVVDEGSRADYGLQVLSRGKTIGDWEVFGGQSFNFNDPEKTLAARQQGLAHRSSHYVFRANASPIPGWVTFNYKGRFSRSSLENRFSKVGGKIGPKELNASANYIFASKRSGTREGKDFKQLTFSIVTNPHENWTGKFSSRYDFSRDRKGLKTPRDGKLSQSFEVAYHNDCFTIEGGVARNFFRDRDVKPGTAVMISVTFKNLGQFGHKFNLTKTSQTEEGPRTRKKKYF